MEYLVWAWRVYFGQIALGDVPEMIRGTCAEIVDRLRMQDVPML